MARLDRLEAPLAALCVRIPRAEAEHESERRSRDQDGMRPEGSSDGHAHLPYEGSLGSCRTMKAAAGRHGGEKM